MNNIIEKEEQIDDESKVIIIIILLLTKIVYVDVFSLMVCPTATF